MNDTVTSIPSQTTNLYNNWTDFPWNTIDTSNNFTYNFIKPNKYFVKIYVKVPRGKSEKLYFDKARMKYTGGTPETEKQFWDFFDGKNNVLVFFFKSNKDDIEVVRVF